MKETQMFTKLKDPKAEIVYCKEGWHGNSRDGMYLGGEGYTYFEMTGKGEVLSAIEYYETDDGDEKVCEVPELKGINWFAYFGFEDDEVLEIVNAGEYLWIEDLLRRNAA
jgi:hypothetical protein